MQSLKPIVNSKKSKKCEGIFILRDFLALPIFTLSTYDARRIIVAPFNGGEIMVDAHPDSRLPTQHDADVFIWLMNYVLKRQREGNFEYTVKVNLHRIMTDMGRGYNQKSYTIYRDSIIRLLSTRITFRKTRDYKKKGWSGGSFLSGIVYENFEEIVFLDVDVPRWLFKIVQDPKSRLMVNRDYYRIVSNFEKRLYNVIRKLAGKDITHPGICLRKLYDDYYGHGLYREFVANIRKIVRRQSIPDYWLKLQYSPKRQDPYRLFFMHEIHLKGMGVDKHELNGLPLSICNGIGA